MTRTGRVPTAVIAVVLLGAGCHKTAVRSDEVRTDEAPPTLDVTHDRSTVYDVTFTDNTVMIDLATVKHALRSATAGGEVLVFDPVPEIQTLQPGSILLVKGVGMRKILAVMPFEGKIALLVTEAAITDVIKNGHIHVEHEVGFDATSMLPGPETSGAPHVALAEMVGGINPAFGFFQGAGQAAAVRAKVQQLAQAKVTDLWQQVSGGSDSANHGLGGCGKVSGWDFCVHGSRGASRINLRASLAKSVYGFLGTIKADGYLDNFRMVTDLAVADGSLSSFTWDTKNANGLINFQVIAAKDNKEPNSTTDVAQAIPLPGSFQATFLVGPLPLSLKVSFGLLVHPGFTGMNQLWEANFRMTYNSTQHLSLRGGNLDDDGNVGATTENLLSNTMLTGPYGFVVALAGPRIEVGFDAASIWGSLTAAVPDELAKRAAEAFLDYGPVKALLNGPAGPQIQQALDLVGTAAAATLKSKAAVHLDFILSVGVLSGGAVTMIPCQKTTEEMNVQVGANASLFGMDVKDSLKKVLFHHTWEQGPSSGPCAIDKAP